jgi:hypothetical protein
MGSPTNGVLDLQRAAHSVVVLPEPQNNPPRRLQCRRRRVVPCAVALDLWTPVRHVQLRLLVVNRAAVPVAPVYEDSDPRPREHQVSSAPELREWSHGDAVTQAEGVHSASHRQLRSGVPTPVADHRASDRVRAGPRLMIAHHRTRLRRSRRGPASRVRALAGAR